MGTCIKIKGAEFGNSAMIGNLDISKMFEFTDGYALSLLTETYSMNGGGTSTVFSISNIVDVSGFVGKTLRIKVMRWTTASNNVSANGLSFFAETPVIGSTPYLLNYKFPKSQQQGVGVGESFDKEIIVPEGARYLVTTYFRESKKTELGEDDFKCLVLSE